MQDPAHRDNQIGCLTLKVFHLYISVESTTWVEIGCLRLKVKSKTCTEFFYVMGNLTAAAAAAGRGSSMILSGLLVRGVRDEGDERGVPGRQSDRQVACYSLGVRL